MSEAIHTNNVLCMSCACQAECHHRPAQLYVGLGDKQNKDHFIRDLPFP